MDEIDFMYDPLNTEGLRPPPDSYANFTNEPFAVAPKGKTSLFTHVACVYRNWA